MTFEVIATTFLVHRGLAMADVPITAGKDEQVSPEITDPGLSEQFRRYHAQVAALDFVKSDTNLAQSARHRLRPTRIRPAVKPAGGVSATIRRTSRESPST
jgi:hypothetical protein